MKFSNGSDVVKATYLLIVSVLLVSFIVVSFIVVSVRILVSVVMVVESEAEVSDFFVLQAATDNERARAKKPNLNEFFILGFLKFSLVIINTGAGNK